MNRLIAFALATTFLFFANAAIAADLHDPDATFKAFEASQQANYGAFDAQYREAVAAAPQDVALAVAHCRFIDNFAYAEDINWTDSASDDLDACRVALAKRWPDAPLARVYELEYTNGKEATPLAEKVWAASTHWPDDLRAQIAARLHELYKDDDKDKAGEYAVVAARLGNPELVAAAIKHLAGKGENKQATNLAAQSKAATSGWMAEQRMTALIDMGANSAARRELDRSIKLGLDVSAANQVQTYIADHDLKTASKAAAKLGTDEGDKRARFDLALATGQLAKARELVSFKDGFNTWVARYSKVVPRAPIEAFGLPLLPFTLVLLLCVFATALVPGFLLVPVHYRGLARRVHDRAPMPMFERIGLRHSWYAGAVILIVPALAILVMRPDAIGALFTGGEESASTQFSVVAAGSLLSLLALLPWLRRLRMSPMPGREALRLRTAGVVLGCWLIIFAIGVFSALVHKGLIGGDSSTLQTRTVEALVRNSWTEYGVLATWLVIGLMAPIVEEIVFRGMLLGGMSRHISFGWANTLQGALFAAIHGDPPRFFVYFALGLFGGWLARRYRSLLPAIALHVLNNSMALLLHG